MRNTNTGTTSNFSSISTQAVNNTIQGIFGSSHYSSYGGAVTFAGSQSAHPFKILTNNTVKVTVDTSGNVGIGTTAPDQPLQVKGVIETQASNSTNGWMMYTYTDNTFRLNYNGAGSDEVTVLSDGRVGIGATTTDTSIRAGHKMTIKETATENASIVFTDTDDMVGVIVGYAKGNNELVSGTTNVDAVLGTAYGSDVHLFTNNSIGLTLLNGGGSAGNVGCLLYTSPSPRDS